MLSTNPNSNSDSDTALEILNKRYAKGEIDTNAYDEKRTQFEQTTPSIPQ
jgi:uncharacterized membrane protein